MEKETKSKSLLTMLEKDLVNIIMCEHCGSARLNGFYGKHAKPITLNCHDCGITVINDEGSIDEPEFREKKRNENQHV